MSLNALHRAMRIISEDLEKAIRAVLLEYGVPTGTATLYELVELIYPLIKRARVQVYAEQCILMGEEIAKHNLQVKPAPLRDYGAGATFKALAKVLDIDASKRAHLPVSMLDDKSIAEAGEKVLVDESTRLDPEVVDAALSKIMEAAERHAFDAGRQAVADTAAGGKVRPDPKTRPSRSDYRAAEGVELGWARVLTGAENCPWCAMLASRGPVYSKDTVLTASGKHEGRTFHANCDCKAVLVVKGKRWDGEAEYKRLKALWDSASEDPTMEEAEQGLERPIDRFSKRWRDTEDKSWYSPLEAE